MNFDKRYDRHEFLRFLESFLPEDFTEKIEEVHIDHKTTYIRQVTRLGRCQSLDLLVYEMRHNSVNDARVGLSKEAFRFLANEWEGRALVLFVPENNDANYRFSLITIDLDMTEEGKTLKRYSNPRRYSYYLGEGIAWYTPNKYLNAEGRVKDEKDLIERFSVEVLTKAFYQELSDWYAWAVKVVRFPNKLNDPTDDDKFNAESTIRLVTRLIFVWFLKQKHLIPEEFFDKEAIGKLIKGFSPNTVSDLLYQKGESVYYKAILQNLFFAMLNSPITPEGSTDLSERHFRNGRSDYDNNKLMRYESCFKEPQLFVDLANRTVPFLNGGLFDCLDDKDNGIYIDGFSDREKVQRSLLVPDYLFFIEGHVADLSLWYNDRRKSTVKIDGIINILKRYNFTVEENTPFDQEVSLDPELLGKVFENLLASYNPETQTTARKQTGSFYTPREIVQYMVDESLVAHLKRTVGDELEEQYRQLMRYTDEEVLLTDAQRKQIMQSLYHCKVLDPACGSGAFPMGMLQQMVHILNRIDPNNEMWKEMMRQAALCKQDLEQDEIQEVEDDLNRNFNDGFNRPDYARKLYLIENCIYGVDIQPIAIQISKLRFFISLVVDQKANDNPAENFGIRPLPNLEAKFMAANTLIGLDKKDSSLFDTPEILAKKEELKIAKHKIFGAKTVRTKRKYKDAVNRIRQEIAELLRSMGAIGESEAAVLASWDMFDQNASSPFFDPEWMFDVKEGFDIVIGNPPYGTKLSFKEKNLLSKLYPQATKKIIDIYNFFQHKAISLSKDITIFIVPPTWLTNVGSQRLRSYLIDNGLVSILYIDDFVFESAIVNSVVYLTTDKHIHKYIRCFEWNKSQIKQTNNISIKTYEKSHIISRYNTKSIWGETPRNEYKLLGEISKIVFGIQDRKDKTSPSYIHYEKINSLCKPALRGKDIYKYSLKYDGIYIEYGKWLWNARTPDIFESNEKILIRQVGAYPICAYDNQQYYTLNTIYNIVITDNDFNCKYVLGILNSKLIQYIWQELFPETKKIFPRVKKEQMVNIPIIIANSESQNQIIRIVDTLIALNGENMQEINRLCSQIDMLVYQLYHLKYDDVLIVDPQTPITREEYEKIMIYGYYSKNK